MRQAMETINIHQAKTRLSRLVELAAKGDGFIIAKAGRPMVKVLPLDAPETGEEQRVGFLAGRIEIPDDFDEIGQAEIEARFEASQ